MTKASKAEHCRFEDNVLNCVNCGGTFTLALPMDIDKFGKKTKAFIALHQDCPPRPSGKQYCAARGMVRPGCMCGYIRVGDKSCGAQPGYVCKHQTSEQAA